MKNTKNLVLLLLSAILSVIGLSSEAFASSFAVYMSGPEVFEGSTTITVSVGGFNDFNGFCGLTAGLNYDPSKISISPSGLSGFNLLYGSQIVLDAVSAAGSGTSVLSLNITNVGLAGGESTTISLTGIEGTDCNVLANAPNVSKTITLKASEPPAPTPTPKPDPSPAPAPAAPSNSAQPSASTSQATQTQNANESQASNDAKEGNSSSKDNNDSKKNGSSEEKKTSTIEFVENPEKRDETTSAEERTNSPVLLIVAIALSSCAIGVGIWFFFVGKKKRKH